jgi:hypothetical protein
MFGFRDCLGQCSRPRGHTVVAVRWFERSACRRFQSRDIITPIWGDYQIKGVQHFIVGGCRETGRRLRGSARIVANEIVPLHKDYYSDTRIHYEYISPMEV